MSRITGEYRHELVRAANLRKEKAKPPVKHPLDPYVGKTVQLEVELYSVDRMTDGTVKAVTVGREGYELVVDPAFVTTLFDADMITNILWDEIRTIEGLEKRDMKEAVEVFLRKLTRIDGE